MLTRRSHGHGHGSATFSLWRAKRRATLRCPTLHCQRGRHGQVRNPLNGNVGYLRLASAALAKMPGEDPAVLELREFIENAISCVTAAWAAASDRRARPPRPTTAPDRRV